jgi:hypothetical protein
MHTSGVGSLLLLGMWALLGKVPSLTTVVAWSPDICSSSRGTTLSSLNLWHSNPKKASDSSAVGEHSDHSSVAPCICHPMQVDGKADSKSLELWDGTDQTHRTACGSWKHCIDCCCSPASVDKT